MQYLGGKSRIAKYLVPFLESERKGKVYLEPFMGAGHIIIQMAGKRVGSDCHPDLMEMWCAVQLGWLPPESVKEEEYKQLKRQQTPSPLRGYVGFQGSWGGKWFGGYARNQSNHNYVKAGLTSLRYARSKLQDVTLLCCDYREWSHVEDWLIYCDPPYEGFTSYTGVASFDHSRFWKWVCHMGKSNKIFVSSYQAPDNFRCVLEIPTTTNLQVAGGGKSPRIECLFTPNPK